MGNSIALLRGINVGGRTRMPMEALRELCISLGWQDVRSYIQSGNVIFSADGTAAAQEAALEEAIRARFGMSIPVLVRSPEQWNAYLKANPFPTAAEQEPNRLMLSLSKRQLAAGAVTLIQERATNGERVGEAAGGLWIHYPVGAGASKLSPSLVDRLAGSPVTARNWRTVTKLAEMAAA